MQNQLRCAPYEVSRGDICIGSLSEYDLSMGMFFAMLSHRAEICAGFRACGRGGRPTMSSRWPALFPIRPA